MANPAGDDALAVVEEFDLQTHIDSTELQERTAEGGARELCWRPFGKEPAATNKDFARMAGENRNLIDAVQSLYRQRLELVHLIDLDSIRPLARTPVGEIRYRGDLAFPTGTDFRSVHARKSNKNSRIVERSVGTLSVLNL